MITTATEYFANLFKIINTGNYPSLAVLLPSSENIYNIDLESRTIEAPEFLSVLDDHNSETIYFLVDRFFDNMDMSQTACVIQYINALGEGRLYTVPYYDIETFHAVGKMLIPWCIEGEATKAAGDVTYSIRFFKVDPTGKYLTYNLNTRAFTSKVLTGINILDYVQVDISKEVYDAREENGITYYVKKDNGYAPATGAFSSNTKYYTLAEGYNYAADYLDTLTAEVKQLRDNLQANALCWYDAGKDI